MKFNEVKHKYLDGEYLDYLKGKSVVLVGPAQYVSEMDLGESIDNYDVVVRINRGMEVIKDYPDSIGRRTDILYNCLIESLDNGGRVDIPFYKEQGVKWISTIPTSDYNGVCKSDGLHNMVNMDSVAKIKEAFDFHVMNHVVYGDLNSQISCRSNTGFAAIFDLLSHEVDKLFVAGFSFYLDSFIGGYKNGASRDDKQFAEECFVSKRHNQRNQWKFLKKEYIRGFLEDDDTLDVDRVLHSILTMEELDREEFKNATSMYLHTD